MEGFTIKRISNSRDFQDLDTLVRDNISKNSSRKNIKKLLVHVVSHYPHAVAECLPHLKTLARSLSQELK